MSEQHPKHLAHHFETPRQQFESGKLGMWIFLATEILLFGGLFCAYAVYRANHPEIFIYAHQYLDKVLGGINTVVLICSSLTMASAVWCAQTDRRRGLILLLVLTLLGGAGFMGIKYVEYQHKWKHGLLPGKYFQPDVHAEPPSHAEGDEHVTTAPAEEPPQPPTTAPAGEERSQILPAPAGPPGLAPSPSEEAEHGPTDRPRNVHIFFGVYFAMTGLHGLHVLAGMGVIAWILVRSIKGHFGSHYFAPVDLVGLYWHLVDMIWIYLFPLLYLIH